ncbi:aldehyde dehydrogenase [Lacticaseibacillus sp. GG6-2]
MADTTTALKHYQMYLAGKFVDSASGDTETVINPATEEPLGTFPLATVAEADAAVEAAVEAQKSWRELPAPTRGKYLAELARELRAHADTFIDLLIREQGKIHGLAETEVTFSADYLDYMAAAGRMYEGEVVQSDNPAENIMIAKQPIGVAVGILAWNFPLFLIVRKLAPALVTGNAIVLKPSSETPMIALEFAKLVDAVGIPAGVVSVIPGSGSSIGSALSANPAVGIISLTGSVNSGKKVMATAANHVAKVSLELGGKAPAIVAKDADLDMAVQAIVDSRIDNNGQVCNNAERVYVQEDVADEFVAKLTEKLAAVKVGDPSDPSAEMGPLINRAALEKVDGMVQRAVAQGGVVTTGGHPVDTPHGFFYQPTVITHVQQDWEIVQNEIFGPVLPIVTYKTLKEAVAMANDTRYGLTSSIYTRDLEAAAYAANTIEAGETYINRFNFEAIQGFHAGWKESGVGGADGRHGIEEFLNTHAVYLQRHPETLD